MKNIENVLKKIIGDIDEDVDFGSLDYDAPLRDQLDFDSMDFLDIVMGLRREYGIKIDEKDYRYFETMSGSINYLFGKV